MDIENSIIKCQICIEINYDCENSNGLKCIHCSDGFVCNNCMRDIKQCPLCRRYDWYTEINEIQVTSNKILILKNIRLFLHTIVYLCFLNALLFITGYLFLCIDKNFKCRNENCKSLIENSEDIGYIYTWGFIVFVIVSIFYNIYDNNCVILRVPCNNCIKCIMCEND